MKCPRCGYMEDKVLESRVNKDGTAIRRRRQCLKCEHRFTSYEKIEEKPIIVIKKDGRQQPFDINKVERGIRTCTEKLKIDHSDIEKLLRNVENRINDLAGTNRMIHSTDIGEETLRQLYSLSPVAYVRFASVYRAFDELDKFISEIERIASQQEDASK